MNVAPRPVAARSPGSAPVGPRTPVVVTDLDMAFGGGGNMEAKLMVPWGEIPDDFKRQHNKWVQLQQQWFFNGLKGYEFTSKDGVDPKAAWRHLKVIQGSFAPKHEHKGACVAYLLSLWFDDFKAPSP